MTKFEPFDSEYEIDKTVLTEEIPSYLRDSLWRWLTTLFSSHSIYRRRPGNKLVLDGASFLHPLQETFRMDFPEEATVFLNYIFDDIKLFRNVLSYILQNIANVGEARELEAVLARCSSAYAVEFIKGDEIIGLKGKDGIPIFEHAGCKLAYRVTPIVKKQAVDAFNSERLLAEAWEAYYEVNPDDEKVVTRATDALSGAIRDKYFPTEKRPVFGTLLNKLKQDPLLYPLPSNTIYSQKHFLEVMNQFSKIRGNHKKGTGRAPTHEEAGFVLHFAIMFYQLLRSKP